MLKPSGLSPVSSSSCADSSVSKISLNLQECDVYNSHQKSLLTGTKKVCCFTPKPSRLPQVPSYLTTTSFESKISLNLQECDIYNSSQESLFTGSKKGFMKIL